MGQRSSASPATQGGHRILREAAACGDGGEAGRGEEPEYVRRMPAYRRGGKHRRGRLRVVAASNLPTVSSSKNQVSKSALGVEGLKSPLEGTELGQARLGEHSQGTAGHGGGCRCPTL